MGSFPWLALNELFLQDRSAQGDIKTAQEGNWLFLLKFVERKARHKPAPAESPIRLIWVVVGMDADSQS